MNGCQLAGLTKNAPTQMKTRITVTLMATMTLLKVADSETPTTSTTVITSTTNTAGRLNSDVTTDDAAAGTTVPIGNWIMEPAGINSCEPAVSSRKCVVAGSRIFVASSNTAWLSVFTAMSSALVSA